jgi:transcriptional regulator with XRE-family HTH domain
MHKWSDIRGLKVPAEQEAAAAASKEALALALELSELRTSRGVTQVQLAERIGKRQSTISELERRNDAFVSSLREYVEALGGHLEIAAVFDDQERVRLAIAG